MTLTKLAEMAGTSVSTVSKAFAGSREISRQTKERIFEVARKLGCFEKYYKGPREAPIIALVVPECESDYYANEAGIFERELSRRGADTLIALTRFDREREARLFQELAYRMKVDGVIVFGNGTLIRNPDQIPLVTLGFESISANNADFINTDLEKAISDAVLLLKEYGHKEIGFIGEELTIIKLKYFKKALRYHGLPINDNMIVTVKERFYSGGQCGMKKIIESGTLPSAIITAYDDIAYGAMRYATSLGYKIPDDISFVGINDTYSNGYFDIPLTSVHINLEDVCEEIIDLIFRKIENRYFRSRTKITIPTSLKLRASLKKIK